MAQGNLITFPFKSGKAEVKVHLKGETVWLNLNELSQLFERDKSVISRHIKNIFKEEELKKDSVVAFFATTASDGKTYQVEYYNLDLIISLGYRVNSKRGIEFRHWASSVLKDYLIKGYTFNQKRLEETGFKDFERLLKLTHQTLSTHLSDIGQETLNIIGSYAKSWHLLLAYDENTLESPQITQEEFLTPSLAEGYEAIFNLKKDLIAKKEASLLFGSEKYAGALDQIFGTIHQTFGGKALYPSLLERAAHLFYFVIKDHPFNDGNKRIACLLLLLYLKYNKKDIHYITNEALVALALLVAQSDPQDKDLMVKLVLNLLNEY